MPSGDLAQAIRLAHAGIYQLNPSVGSKLVNALNRPTPGTAAPDTIFQQKSAVNAQHGLTQRELEVLLVFFAFGSAYFGNRIDKCLFE